LHMKRHIPPRRPILAQQTADDGTTTLIITRPPLGYPEAVFAAGKSARDALLKQIENASPPTIRDPDTACVRLRVLLRLPVFDPSADEHGWIEWYTTSRPFPTEPNRAIELTLDWRNAANYRDLDISAQLGADGMVTGPLLLVRSRDIRIEVRAIGRNDLSYFASESARIGDRDAYEFHAIASDETDETALLANLPPQDQLKSVFLRPDPIGERAMSRGRAAQNDPSAVLVERLAIAADLVADGSMLLGRPGERLAIGCAGLAHHAAPDATSLEFAEPGELAGQWLNVVQLILDRDWTWRGQGSPTVRVHRHLTLKDAPGFTPSDTELGVIELMNTINVQARTDPQREYSRIVFIDAFTPPLYNGLPYEVEICYEMQVYFEGASPVKQDVKTRLPVATTPRQVPKVVAAGIALTDYIPDENYATTASRVKRLWLEFESPLEDDRDAYFVRPLTLTPDPMLLPDWQPVEDPDVLDPVPVDPEPMRVITPDQVPDLSGSNAMQRLEPADGSNVHFLVPLPPNTAPNSPELFSFYTYEIRVGHKPGPSEAPFWSTAQARFGEALTLEGVQHPLPELVCSVIPGREREITVIAPFATPYLGLKRVIPNRPNTEIWFVLYARLMQADGTTWRNVQIDLKASTKRLQEDSILITPQAEAHWSNTQVIDLLTRAGLDPDTALTVLAVELLPEPNASFADPLGGDLGQVRIIRTSPLAEAPQNCCV